MGFDTVQERINLLNGKADVRFCYAPLTNDRVNINLRVGYHYISEIRVTHVENSTEITDIENPVVVKGTVLISNDAKAMAVPFTYYHSVLKIDLSPFPWQRNEIELIRARVMQVCTYSYVNIGEHTINMSELKLVMISWAYLLLGVFGGFGICLMVINYMNA